VRRRRAWLIVRPSITGIRPRRTVSTSGSSGNGLGFRDAVAVRLIGTIKSGRHEAQGLGDKTLHDDQTRTHFGNRSVPEADKAGLVKDVFTSVASKYDVMNDAMSLGIHRLWKDAMLDWLAPRPDTQLLDLAGGTGDIAFRFLARVRGQGRATVLDMTQGMLDEGRKRAEALRLADRLDWVCGDAMALPFGNASQDYVTMSFGIRNVTRIADVVAEAFRVLKPGGRFLVLEFSRIPVSGAQKLYDLYSFNVIPPMGKAITGDRDSYQYLVESIRKFPPQEEFAGMIRAGGFEQVSYRNLSLGIAALHSGWKI
jgi:demethylmenaquinone methyltransferase / 2-methoxy-6-polyprenyl-1,4-benzoquinol methylase